MNGWVIMRLQTELDTNLGLTASANPNDSGIIGVLLVYESIEAALKDWPDEVPQQVVMI